MNAMSSHYKIEKKKLENVQLQPTEVQSSNVSTAWRNCASPTFILAIGSGKKRVDCMCFVTDCTLEVRCFASFVCNSLTPVTLSAAEQQLGLVLAPGLTVNSTLQATDHSNTLPWSHMWHAACALGSGRSCCSLSHTPVIFYLVLLKPDVIN